MNRVFFSLLLIGMSVHLTGQAHQRTSPAPYGEALQKSLFFFDAQRAGRLPAGFRINWRGPSCLRDGRDIGADLSEGWFDASGPVKRTDSLSYAATMLAWGLLESPRGYKRSNQSETVLAHLGVATGYLQSCFVNNKVGNEEFVAQVGDTADESLWAAYEVADSLLPRPTFRVSAASPGGDIVAQAAAACASSSVVFRRFGRVPSADRLLRLARRLLEFASKSPGTGQWADATGRLHSRRLPSAFQVSDKIAWAALWLHQAEREAETPNYKGYLLKQAEDWLAEVTGTGTNPVGFGLSDLTLGNAVLIHRLTRSPASAAYVSKAFATWLNGAGPGIRRTPGGLVRSINQNHIGETASVAFLGLLWADLIEDPTQQQNLKSFAVQQAGYLLGENPTGRSFMVGCGRAPFNSLYHATAFGPWAGAAQLEPSHPDHQSSPRHLLYGAVPSGPDENDRFTPFPPNPISGRVSLETQAGFPGLFSRLYQLYGGEPIPNFPTKEPPDEEVFLEARTEASDSNNTVVQAFLNNHAAWPARGSRSLSFRYYFRLPDKMGPESVSTLLLFSEGATIGPVVRASGQLFYVSIDFSATHIFPGGYDRRNKRPHFRKEVRFRIGTRAGWDPQDDPSFQTLTEVLSKTASLPIYEEGKRQSGIEPPK